MEVSMENWKSAKHDENHALRYSIFANSFRTYEMENGIIILFV